jgi:hypothetical protein
MNTSSAQPTYSITSSDTIDFSSLGNITLASGTSSDTITLNVGNISNGYYTGAGIIGSGSGYVTITGGGSVVSDSEFTFNFPEDWIDCFPDWERIQKMCNEYPGLKIAFEKFKLTYNLVKDDYDTPEDKRIKP